MVDGFSRSNLRVSRGQFVSPWLGQHPYPVTSFLRVSVGHAAGAGRCPRRCPRPRPRRCRHRRLRRRRRRWRQVVGSASRREIERRRPRNSGVQWKGVARNLPVVTRWTWCDTTSFLSLFSSSLSPYLNRRSEPTSPSESRDTSRARPVQVIQLISFFLFSPFIQPFTFLTNCAPLACDIPSLEEPSCWCNC